METFTPFFPTTSQWQVGLFLIYQGAITRMIFGKTFTFTGVIPKKFAVSLHE